MDADLDDLLNDALSDFDKEPTEEMKIVHGKEDGDNRPEGPISKKSETGGVTSEGAAGGTSLQPPKEIFEQFFDKNISDRLQQEWDSAMKELVDEDPELASHLQKLSSTLDTAAGATTDNTSSEKPSSGTGGSSLPEDPGTSSQTDLNKIMDATISGIVKSADDVKNMTSASAEEKLMREMQNMGLGGSMGDIMGQMDNAGGPDGDFMSMMEGMMKNLLSKDVLYPTMKEISKFYPGWLETNEGKVPDGDFDRYKQQSLTIDKICVCFEEEREEDSNEVKRQRLNVMMDLVEKMQECGNPPKELLERCGGENPMDMSKIFGAGGGLDPNMFNPSNMSPDGCVIM